MIDKNAALMVQDIMSSYTESAKTLDFMASTLAIALDSDKPKTEIASVLKTHRELVGLLRLADAVLETTLIKMGIAFGGESIQGVGTVAVHRADKKTRYDNDRLISVIASNLADRTMMVDPETGEIPPPAVATQMAVETFADLVGARTPAFSSWRKGAAKAHKIDLDKYSHTEGGRLSVRFEK